MSVSLDRYNAELEYLHEFVNDVLREINWLINMDGACDAFEARGVGDGCRHCASRKSEH